MAIVFHVTWLSPIKVIKFNNQLTLNQVITGEYKLI